MKNLNRVALNLFKTKHQEVIGYPYLINWGKDSFIFKQIVTTYGIEKTQELIDKFFKAVKQDEFLKRTGATVGIFKTQIPKLLITLTNGKGNSDVGRL